MKRYWLFKTEPETYSIDDFAASRRTHWEGIRNYQVRNFICDEMHAGDGVLIYHSNVNPPAVVGSAIIIKAAYPDFTAWDEESPYFDKRSTKDNPVWFMVDVEFKAKFPYQVTLDQIKTDPELTGIMVARKGMRLSIQPLKKNHFARISKLGMKGS